jgi:hypothetical protein
MEGVTSELGVELSPAPVTSASRDDQQVLAEETECVICETEKPVIEPICDNRVPSVEDGPSEIIDPAVVAINLSRLKPASLMKIPVLIGKKELSALVDSGATASLIKTSVLEVVPCTDELQDVIGLGGTTRALGKISCRVECRGVSCVDLSFLVVPDSCLEHDVILGSDFLTANRLIVDMEKRTLRQNFEVGWTDVSYGEEGRSVVHHTMLPVFASSDVRVCSGESVLVPVSVPFSCDGDYYYNGEISRGNLHGIEGVLSFPGEHKNAHVMVCKPIFARDRSEIISKGTIVGSVSSIVDVLVDDVEPDLPWTVERIGDAVDLSGLSSTEASAVLRMLLTHSRTFSQGDSDVGKAAVTEHAIELTDDTPIRQKPRRFPEPIVEAIESQCRELEALDIIAPSKSPWSSPVVPIRKKDGSIRLCIDYRKLNSVTKADRFPMPNLTDLVFSLHGMQYFTSLDLVRGYYQIPLAKSSQEYTAFSTSRSHYQFKRLSFGLKNAPAAFQREMQEILKGYLGKQVLVYIDDILIMSRTLEEHLDLVSSVLHTLGEYGIKIKPSKCQWFRSSVPFLGHIVGSTGLHKAPEYVEKVRNFPKPETIHQLRQFLGLVNFQRKFIPNCSEVAQPLSCLTGGAKKQRLLWTESMETAFNRLKELMEQDMKLSFPDYSEDASPLELHVDASGLGCGACLTQVQQGERRVIAFNSMTFSKPQQQYSTIDRELTAIRWGVKVFRPFLYGVHFILYTDHRPLIFMRNMSSDNSRVARTLQELAEFDFELRYCKGTDNTAADALSRISGTSLTSQPTCQNPDFLPPGLNVLKKVPGGGDSMLHSLLIVMENHRNHVNPDFVVPESIQALRVALIHELLTNGRAYGIQPSKNLRRELMIMKSPGQLLCEEALLVFCGLYGLQVWVHCGMEKPIIHALPGAPLADAGGRVHLQWLAGVHYNPVEETRQYLGITSASLPALSSSADCLLDHVDELEESPEIVMGAQWVDSSCSCGNSWCSTVVVSFDSVHCCALVDTGAQVSVIREDVLCSLPEEMKLDSHSDTSGLTLSGVGEDITGVKGVVVLRFKILDNEFSDPFPFAVIACERLPFCVVLGANFILSYSVKLDFANQTMSFKLEDETFFCPFRPQEASSAQVQLCFAHEIHDSCDADPKLQSLIVDDTDLAALQAGDLTLRILAEKVVMKEDPRHWQEPMLQRFSRYFSRLVFLNDLLWYSVGESSVPVVTFHFLVEIAYTVHERMAHIGRHKLVRILAAQIWHPDVERVARDVCSSCLRCQMFKISHQTVAPPMLKLSTSCPFDLVSVDLIEFPRSSRGFVAVLMVVDQNSKWLVAVPLKDKKGHTVAHALEFNVLPVLPRCPVRLLSDNGPEFRCASFNDVLVKFSIKHTYSTPYCPASNGGIERANRTIAEMLRGLVLDGKQWDLHLPRAVMVYNNTLHRELGLSPAEYLLSKAHDVKSRPLVNDDTRDVWKPGHPRFAPFIVDQRVMLKVQQPGNLTVNKLKPRFSGPYRVVKVHDNGVTYVVEKQAEDGSVLRKSVHYRQVKPFHEPPAYLLEHPCFQSTSSCPVVPTDYDSDYDIMIAGPIFVSGDSSEQSGSEDKSSCAPATVPGVPVLLKAHIRRRSKRVRRRVAPVREPSVAKELELLPCSESVPSRVAENTDVVHVSRRAPLSSTVLEPPVPHVIDGPVLPDASSIAVPDASDIGLAEGFEKCFLNGSKISDLIFPESAELVFDEEGMATFNRASLEASGLLEELESMADLCLNLFDESVTVADEVRGDSSRVDDFRFSGFDVDGLHGSLSWFSGLQRSRSADSIFEGFQARATVNRLADLRRIIQSARLSIEENRRNSLTRFRELASSTGASGNQSDASLGRSVPGFRGRES